MRDNIYEFNTSSVSKNILGAFRNILFSASLALLGVLFTSQLAYGQCPGDGSTAVCESSTTSITLASFVSNYTAGGTWSNGSGTFNPTGVAPGNYSFTYMLTGCPDASVTVTITDQPTAGSGGLVTVCPVGTVNLDNYLNGNDSGGTWTTNNDGGGSLAGSNYTYDAAAPGTYSFTYTIAAAGGCAASSAVVQVVVADDADAGTPNNLELCDTFTGDILLGTGLIGEDPGGTWTISPAGPTLDQTAGTISGPFTAGLYTVTYSFVGCGTSESYNITIYEFREAGTPTAPLQLCADGGTAVDLSTLLTGDEPGGSWMPLSSNPDGGAAGIAGTFGVTSGTTLPGTYTFRYFFNPSVGGVCPGDEAFVSVVVLPEPTPGTCTPGYICEGSTTPFDLASILSGESPGGTWSETTASGGTITGNFFDPTIVVAGTYTFQYDIPANATTNCGAVMNICTVVVGPQPDAGDDVIEVVCNLDNPGAITMLPDGTPSTGGTWTASTTNPSTAPYTAPDQFDQFGATPGTYVFTYSFDTSGGCAAVSSTYTIEVINSAKSAGDDNTMSICETGATMIDLTTLLLGADAGGTWSNGTGVFDATTAGPGTHLITYSFPPSGCGPGSIATMTIIIEEQFTAGEGTMIMVCGDAGLITLADHIDGEDAGGIWTANQSGGTFNAVTGEFDPTGAAAGNYTFTYTIVGTQCASDATTVTIGVKAAGADLTAGGDQSYTICTGSTAAIDLNGLLVGASAGGDWLPNAAVAGYNDVTGILDPTGMAVACYTFDYTFAGSTCVDATDDGIATIQVCVNPGESEAGDDHTVTICDGSIHTFAIPTGATSTTGTWVADPTNPTTGTFNSSTPDFDPTGTAAGDVFKFLYYFPAAGTCVGDTAICTIVIEDANISAGAGGTFSICAGTDPIDLSTFLTGESAGGMWTTTCALGTLDGATGMYTPSAGGTCTFTYSVGGIGCTTGQTADVILNMTMQQDPGPGGNFTVCAEPGAFDMTTSISMPAGAVGGGQWTQTSGPGGIPFDGVQTFDPNLALAGVYTFTYTFPAIGGCPAASATYTVTVNEDPLSAGIDNGLSVCSGSTINLATLISGEDPGGVWTTGSCVGPITNAAAVDLSCLTAGAYTFTYTITSPNCTDVSVIANLTVVDAPDAGDDKATTICTGPGTAIALTTDGLPDPGGTWSADTGNPIGGTFSATAPSFNPTGAPFGTYVFYYTVAGSGGCPADVASCTIKITNQLDAGVGGSITVCDDNTAVDLSGLLTSADPGGVWAASTGAPALVGTTATFTAVGTFTYTYTHAAAGNCAADVAAITVEVVDCAAAPPCICAVRYDAGNCFHDDQDGTEQCGTGGVVPCGTDAGSMTSFDGDGDGNDDKCAYAPGDFLIDVASMSCHDPATGYMITPSNPQAGEDILWINFDVSAFTSTFQIQVNDSNDSIGWAIYESIVPTNGPISSPLSGNCGSLQLLKCGTNSQGMWNTIAVNPAQYQVVSNYYIAIWDQSDNTELNDEGDGTCLGEFTTRMGCGVEDADMCSFYISNTDIIDNNDGTYCVEIDVVGVNGEYFATDPLAISVTPDPVCLFNYSVWPPQATQTFTLCYDYDVCGVITVGAMDTPTDIACTDPVNSCIETLLICAPSVECEIDCTSPTQIGGIYPYGDYPSMPTIAPPTFNIVNSCGSQPIQTVYADIITADPQPGFPNAFKVTRTYTYIFGCQIPGTSDDCESTCVQEFYLNIEPSTNCSCPLNCNNNVQISIGNDCDVFVTPDMILEGAEPSGCNYYVVLEDANGNAVGNPVTRQYIGQTLKVAVKLVGCDGPNECWGTVLIEDKLPPALVCPSDITIGCNSTWNLQDYSNSVSDNCGGNVEMVLISDDTQRFDCNEDPDYCAVRTVVFTIRDESGNTAPHCTQTIYYAKRSVCDVNRPANYDGLAGSNPVLTCDQSFPLDDNGNPHPSHTGAPRVDGRSIFPNNGFCKMEATYTDHVIGDCASAHKILRQWVVLDWCNPTGNVVCDDNGTPADPSDDTVVSNPVYFNQIIKIVDNKGPVASCPIDMEFDADPYTCAAVVTLDPPFSIFDCSNNITYSVAILLADSDGNPPANGNYVGDQEILSIDEKATVGELPSGRTWVRYTLYDECGNTGHCFTEVDVIDHQPPTAVCDENTVVTLNSQGTARVWAKSFDDESHDNCSEIVSYEVERMVANDDCDPIPALRDFVDFCATDIPNNPIQVMLRVTDAAGNSNSCMVNVTVQVRHTDNPDIPGTNPNCPDYTFSSDDWPADQFLDDGCVSGTDPSAAGVPDITGAPNTVAYTHTDQVFDFQEDACFKILRRWVVIDWCQYEGTGTSASDAGIWRHTQVIKVTDSMAPVFEAECMTADIGDADNTCIGSVVLTPLVEDGCTPLTDLSITYDIDYHDNGSVDQSGGGTFSSSEVPMGTHKVTWTADDKCGNSSQCTAFFEIKDTKLPTPYCLGAVTTVVMPSNGTVAVWANDFDRGSFDNCTGDLTFTMRAAGSDDSFGSSLTYTCSDLGLQRVEVRVTDASGNSDYCVSNISIQSSTGCDSTGEARIAGLINTEENVQVENVAITLDLISQGNTDSYMTSNTGSYVFGDMLMSSDYSVTAAKVDDHANGITTLDLVLIQRHILGLQDLPSAYKVIAADVNNSQSVTAADIVELRKLILGIVSEYSNNDSWRFVDASQTFTNIFQPWPFRESIDITQLTGDDMDNDFVAVKIGDITADAQVNLASSLEVRSNKNLNLVTKHQRIEAGNRVVVPIKVEEDRSLVGMQFTLTFDPSELQYLNTSSARLDIADENINAKLADRGVITFSWNDIKSADLKATDDLFSFEFIASSTGDLSDKIQITSDRTVAEAYSRDLEVEGIQLDFETDTEDGQIVLYQNTPNPFTEYTSVRFDLPEANDATLSVYTVTGKKVWTVTKSFNRGQNTVNIDKEDMSIVTGVMYYELEIDGMRYSKKMILIE